MHGVLNLDEIKNELHSLLYKLRDESNEPN